MAPPKKIIDESLLDGLARIGCTDEEMALLLHCSSDTLVRRYAERIKKGRAEMKMSLRRQQIRLMEQGNATMAIWLGKQNLGQRDTIHIDVNKLDTDIERELAVLTAGGQGKASGEIESEAVN